MRIGKIIALPDAYSRFARVSDETGTGFTADAGDIPKGAKLGDDVAYKVEIWGNDSGLAYELETET